MSDNPFLRRPAAAPASRGPQGLADVLERILDKGLVIAGDIQINLLDIELLTVKVRLLVASADTAQQMGIDWWKHDPWLSSRDRELAQENAILRDRLVRIEEALGVQVPSRAEGELAVAADLAVEDKLPVVPDEGDRLISTGRERAADGGGGSGGGSGGGGPKPSSSLAREAELPPLSKPPGSVSGEHHPEVQEKDP
ncbi:MAG: gas vesicle protein [Nitriliruptor sp.]